MFTNILLDKYVVIPNHFHGIIGFDGQPKSSFTNKNTDLGKIIKRFKLETIRKVKNIVNNYIKVFSKNYKINKKLDQNIFLYGEPSLHLRQKSYYDHIIRDEKDLKKYSKLYNQQSFKTKTRYFK